MRVTRILPVLAAATVVALTVGCAGPERKLGRGIMNLTEPMRAGEMRLSMEQTSLFENADRGYSVGFVQGLNRTFSRSLIGAYEILTFPFPGYDAFNNNPLYPNMPEHPVYPHNYKPQLWSDSAFETDTNVGFTGGDVAPWFPGSRFRVFEK